MKRMYAIIMMEYVHDRSGWLVQKETILEVVHGLRRAQKRARELEAIYDGTKLIDVVYVAISQTRDE